MTIYRKSIFTGAWYKVDRVSTGARYIITNRI